VVKAELMREKTFNIRFSEEEWERLDRLSTERGINAASLIRMLLKQADTAPPRQPVPTLVVQEAPPKVTKKKTKR
jgi:hypothetical protein